MARKILFAGGVLGLMLLPLLASAQSGPAPLDATALGALEGSLNFCSKVNPEKAAKYKEMGKALTRGQSEDAVARTRNSQEYKDSFDQISKQFEKLSPKEASAACKENSAGK